VQSLVLLHASSPRKAKLKPHVSRRRLTADGRYTEATLCGLNVDLLFAAIGIFPANVVSEEIRWRARIGSQFPAF
jgi:hypothetical protein